MVYRVYVEKKNGQTHEADSLLREIRDFLQIDGLTSVRVLNRYDAENLEENLFAYAVNTVFSEPQVDDVSYDTPAGQVVFAVEPLPGQYDQRADSAAQCIQIISQGNRPTIRTAKVYVLSGALTEEQIAAITAKFEQNPPEDEESAHAMLVEATKYRDTISSYEQEMRRMVKDSADCEQKQRSCRHEAAKVKVEFDQLKVLYDKEIGEKKAALDAQRAVAAAKAVGIDPKLMEEYNTIKKRIMPPMARLVGNQCSGCNTAQPSSLLSKIKSGAELIECETCGRMIIQ